MRVVVSGRDAEWRRWEMALNPLRLEAMNLLIALTR